MVYNIPIIIRIPTELYGFPPRFPDGSEGGGRTQGNPVNGKIPLLLVPALFFEIWEMLDALEIFGNNGGRWGASDH